MLTHPPIAPLGSTDYSLPRVTDPCHFLIETKKTKITIRKPYLHFPAPVVLPLYFLKTKKIKRVLKMMMLWTKPALSSKDPLTLSPRKKISSKNSHKGNQQSFTNDDLFWTKPTLSSEDPFTRWVISEPPGKCTESSITVILTCKVSPMWIVMSLHCNVNEIQKKVKFWSKVGCRQNID